MSGLIVFLSILAALLVVVTAVLVFLVISVTWKISHTQKNIQTIQARTHEITETISVASSAIALSGSVMGFFKNIGKKRSRFNKKSGKGTSS